METKKNNRTSKIIHQFLGNSFSKKTEEKVQRWIIEEGHSEEKEKASLEYWNELEVVPDTRTTRQAWKRVSQRVGFADKKPAIPLHRRFLRIAAIVVPVLVLAGGIYHFSQREQMIQVITAYGETKQIILPDSSEVWLNSGSTFQYPSKFKKGTRPVSLEGEAYFSVRKDASKPFIVNTNQLSVKVLGTEFNVKAYLDNSKTVATLNTGKIEVNTVSNQSRTLQPNEQLTYNNKSGSIDITEVQANDISAWTNGQLFFTDTPFPDILQTLERRFGVSFEASPNIGMSAHGYTVKFLKDDNLEQILNVLEDVVGGFSYQEDGNKIKIMPK